MNRSEAAVRRHSRGKDFFNRDAARQKQFFAKSRFEARGASAAQSSSISISFMPGKRLSTYPARRRGSQQPPKNDSRSSHVYHEGIQGRNDELHDTTLLDRPGTVKCTPSNLKDNRAQSAMSVELSKKRKAPRHDLQGSRASVLEAKRQMLLRRSDWVGVGFQKPLPMTFRGPPSIHGKWGFGGRFASGGTHNNRWTRPFKRPHRTDAQIGKLTLNQGSIDIRIGSKSQSQSHNTNEGQFRQGQASSESQTFTLGSNASSNLGPATQAPLQTSLRAMRSHLPRSSKASAHAQRFSNPKPTLHKTGLALQSSSSTTSATTSCALRGSETAPQDNHDNSMRSAGGLLDHARGSTDATSSAATIHQVMPRRNARLQQFRSSTSSSSDIQRNSNPNCPSHVRHVTVSSECGEEEQRQEFDCSGYWGTPEAPRRTTRRAPSAHNAASESSDSGLYEKDTYAPRSECPPMSTSSGSEKESAHVLSRHFTVPTPGRLHRTGRNDEFDSSGGDASVLIGDESRARIIGYSALHLQRRSWTSLRSNGSRSAKLHPSIASGPTKTSFDEGIEEIDGRDCVQHEFISPDDDEALLRDLSLKSWSQSCDEPSTLMSKRAIPPLKNVARSLIATSEGLSNGCDRGEEKRNDKGGKAVWVKSIGAAVGTNESVENASDEAQSERKLATDDVDSLNHKSFRGEHTLACYHFDSIATRGLPDFLLASKSSTGVSYVSVQDSKESILAESAIEADGTSIGPIYPSTTVKPLPSSETSTTHSASRMEASPKTLPSGSTTLDHASITAQPSESNCNEAESKFVGFTRPKQFKGRLATTPQRLAVPLVQLSVRNGIRLRSRQRRKVVDGRPDIRALPDCYDDPIDA